MPAVHYVKHARKAHGECGKCGVKIRKRDPYKWWKFRYGGRRVRCANPKCAPRGSDLTNSDKLSRCYSAGESIEDAIEDFKKDFALDDLKSVMEDAANEIREVAEEYRESSQNMEDGLGHETEQSQELSEKGDNLDGRADEIEQAANDLMDFADWQANRGDDSKKKKDEDDEEQRKEWAEEIAREAEEYTDIDPEG